MRELAETIRNCAPDIIEAWDEESKKTEPYLRLDTVDERLNHLVEVITTLAFASLPEQTRETYQAALDSAARHGTFRREQGFNTETILKEYYFIRNALWAFVRERASDQDRAVLAIGRIDQAAALTSRAAMLGLHRPELEKTGQWPRVIEELVYLPPFTVARSPAGASEHAIDASGR